MRSAVVLIREADESVAVTLDGIVQQRESYGGHVTTRPRPDGIPLTDGRRLDPIRASLQGTIPTSTVPDGTTVGPDRIREVTEALRTLQISGARVAVYTDGAAPLVSMQVERFDLDRDASEDPALIVDLVERIDTRPRVVQLQPLPAATKGPPRADVADGLAATQEQGPTSTVPVRDQSYVAGGLDFGVDIVAPLSPFGFFP